MIRRGRASARGCAIAVCLFAFGASAREAEEPRLVGAVQTVTDEYFVVKSGDGALTIVYFDQDTMIVTEGNHTAAPETLHRGDRVSLTYNRTMGPRFTGRLVTILRISG